MTVLYGPDGKPLSIVHASGDVAHDAADSGNPVKIGGRATDFVEGLPRAAVAVDDRVDAVFGPNGQLGVTLLATDGSAVRDEAGYRLPVQPSAGASEHDEGATSAGGHVGVALVLPGPGGLGFPYEMPRLGESGGLRVESAGVTAVSGTSARGAALAGNPVVEAGRASATVPGSTGQDGTVDGWRTLNGAAVSFPITPTATLSNVAGSASSVTLLAANADRRGATIWNDSAAVLYVKFGATASATSCTVKMIADSYYEVPFGYTAVIDGIWASATGSARITEFS